MNKKDIWVVADYNYDILFEGTFKEASEYAKEVSPKMFMTKPIFEGIRERKLKDGR